MLLPSLFSSSPGFWKFPQCLPCECNGHAGSCEAETGHCIDCIDWTSGVHCEVCKAGYYGDPQLGVDIPCRECPCPNTQRSGHSFADTCHLEPLTNEPVCDCEEGYAGNRCEVCDDNYYGYPEVVGGSCIKCNCSGNWVESDTGNCDPSTGVCLKCIYNSEGDHCEHCKPGYWGDAPKKLCRECRCHGLGTDRRRFHCDRLTGDCHCLPNVEGAACDRCAKDHWKIASGVGCEPCACDPVGSTNTTCDVYYGQCKCKEGFGGDRCDQCEENFWGDPRVHCHDCKCNPIGSMSFQCDHKTGKCVCLDGTYVAGHIVTTVLVCVFADIQFDSHISSR